MASPISLEIFLSISSWEKKLAVNVLRLYISNSLLGKVAINAPPGRRTFFNSLKKGVQSSTYGKTLKSVTTSTCCQSLFGNGRHISQIKRVGGVAKQVLVRAASNISSEISVPNDLLNNGARTSKLWPVPHPQSRIESYLPWSWIFRINLLAKAVLRKPADPGEYESAITEILLFQ